ncbi:MAG: hypothetical protein K9L85_02955 [Candidatus Peribacteraceae bacterium]|nr:hypothetical protein [Candidatus Peribacteraceae bacterium]
MPNSPSCSQDVLDFKADQLAGLRLEIYSLVEYRIQYRSHIKKLGLNTEEVDAIRKVGTNGIVNVQTLFSALRKIETSLPEFSKAIQKLIKSIEETRETIKEALGKTAAKKQNA